MRHEQDHAVARPAFAILVTPLAPGIEFHQRLHPSRPVEIGPLVGEAEMHLDDASADRLEIHHAGVAGEMMPAPVACPAFDGGLGPGTNLPVVEGTVAAGNAGSMAPPRGRTVDQGHVAADVIALKQRHPHVAGLIGGLVISL